MAIALLVNANVDSGLERPLKWEATEWALLDWLLTVKPSKKDKMTLQAMNSNPYFTSDQDNLPFFCSQQVDSTGL